MATEDSTQFQGIEGLEELEGQLEGEDAAQAVSDVSDDDQVIALDTDDDGTAEVVGYDTDGDGVVDYAEADTNDDGTMDLGIQDTNGDGEVDYAYGGEGWEPVTADNTEADATLDTSNEVEVTVETADGGTETYVVDVDGDDEDAGDWNAPSDS